MVIATSTMWKTISILSGIVFTLVLTEVTPKVVNVENSDENHKWNCNEICSNTGAETHFDEETLTCRCVIVTNVDDAEMALIKKNLQLADSHVEPSPNTTIPRNRRYLPRNNRNSAEHDPIVGQAIHPLPGVLPKPQLPVLPNRHQPLLPQPHKPPSPILPHKPLVPHIPHKLPTGPHGRSALPQNPAIQEHLERIRQRMQELANARNAQEHLENIRQRLRELRDRAVNTLPTPEQLAERAKANQARIAKERQRIQQLHGLRNVGRGPLLPHRNNKGLVGVVADDAKKDSATTATPVTKKDKKQESNSNDDSPDSFVNPAHPSSSVITQPEDLIED